MQTILEMRSPQTALVISSHLVDELEKITDIAIYMKLSHLITVRDTSELYASEQKSMVDLYREIYRHGGDLS